MRDLGLEVGHELWTFGPRPDKAHVATDDVEQLRELVKPGGPQKAARARDARVCSGSELGAGRFRLLAHGAELEKVELAAVLAHPALDVKYRTARFELYEQSEEREQDQEGQADDEGKDQVGELTHHCVRPLPDVVVGKTQVPVNIDRVDRHPAHVSLDQVAA